jgi:hypothetical protein
VCCCKIIIDTYGEFAGVRFSFVCACLLLSVCVLWVFLNLLNLSHPGP